MATKNEAARLALANIATATKAVRVANAAYRKSPTDATERAVHDAYESLQRVTARACGTMPVYSRILRDAMARQSVKPGDRWVEISIIEDANKRAGFHFFDAEAIRAFGSRLPSCGYQGTHEVYFVTSEKRPRSDDPRGWTVRAIAADGSMETIGDFQAYGSYKSAERVAVKLAEQSRAAGRPLAVELVTQARVARRTAERAA